MKRSSPLGGMLRSAKLSSAARSRGRSRLRCTQFEPAQQPIHIGDRRPHCAITAGRKILTRGKWGSTCYKARGRPSNASSDPVPEQHAPTAALEGANKSRVNLRSVKIFSRGAGRNFGSKEHDLVGCGHLQPGLHFPEPGRRLLGNISSGSQGMSWRSGARSGASCALLGK